MIKKLLAIIVPVVLISGVAVGIVVGVVYMADRLDSFIDTHESRVQANLVHAILGTPLTMEQYDPIMRWYHKCLGEGHGNETAFEECYVELMDRQHTQQLKNFYLDLTGEYPSLTHGVPVVDSVP